MGMGLLFGKIINKHRADGSRYEGNWKADKKEGKGKLVAASGTIQEGIWYNDKLTSNTEIS